MFATVSTPVQEKKRQRTTPPDVNRARRPVIQSTHVTMTLEEKIGKGGFGTVWKSYLSVNGVTVAVKRVSEEHAEQEQCIHARLQTHPNVISLITVLYEENPPQLSTTVVSLVYPIFDCNLNEIIPKDGFEDGVAHSILHQICAGLTHIHKRKVIHRDFKPQNVLVRRLDIEGRDFHVVVSDFGSSRKVTHENSSLNGSVVSGTLAYNPYELFWKQDRTPQGEFYDYDYKIDAWAFGCVFFKLFMGDNLFPNNNYGNFFGPDVDERKKQALRVNSFGRALENMDAHATSSFRFMSHIGKLYDRIGVTYFSYWRALMKTNPKERCDVKTFFNYMEFLSEKENSDDDHH